MHTSKNITFLNSTAIQLPRHSPTRSSFSIGPKSQPSPSPGLKITPRTIPNRPTSPICRKSSSSPPVGAQPAEKTARCGREGRVSSGHELLLRGQGRMRATSAGYRAQQPAAAHRGAALSSAREAHTEAEAGGASTRGAPHDEAPSRLLGPRARGRRRSSSGSGRSSSRSAGSSRGGLATGLGVGRRLVPASVKHFCESLILILFYFRAMLCRRIFLIGGCGGLVFFFY